MTQADDAFSVLWWKQWQAGIVAGYAFWLAVIGSFPAWLAYQIYRGAEWIAMQVWKLSNKDVEVKPLPPFHER